MVQKIRQIVVIFFRMILHLLPSSMVKLLKANPKILALYSRNLHKSGLLYQLQTLEELSRSYKTYQIHQHSRINNLLSAAGNRESQFYSPGKPGVPAVMNLLVFVPELTAEQLKITINSYQQQSKAFNNILFICQDDDKLQLTQLLLSQTDLVFDVMSDIKAIAAATSQQACFIIYAGDIIAPSVRALLPELISSKTELAYVDTDEYGRFEEVSSPDFKPDWNPDLQLSAGYIRSGLWIDKLCRLSESWFELFTASPHQLSYFDISVFVCRCYLTKNHNNIQHIPLVLLSRPSDKASFSDAAPLLADLYKPFAELLPSAKPTLSLRWHAETTPLVSIIIPTRNGLALVKACIESILNKTTYSNYEILLIDNGSDEQESLQYFSELNRHSKIRLIKYDREFNYSAINNFAANHAKGEVLALVNNDIEVISPDWLLDMVRQVLREDIGCVGAKLLFSDDRVQHAGVVMGYGGGAGHAHKYFPADHHGYMGRLIASHNYSAVTAACLLVTKSDFEAVGGLNEQHLSIAFNDVDFCLKVLSLGRRNLYCAEALLYHHESVSRGLENTVEKQQRFRSELNYLREQWSDVIESDPAYNPNLTLKRGNFSIKGNSEYH